MSRTIAASALYMVLAYSVTPAHAQAPTLPGASVEITVGQDEYYAAGTYSEGGSTSSVFLSPTPILESSENSSNSFPSSNLNYFFSVNGPANTYVPVDIAVNMQNSFISETYGSPQAYSSFSLDSYGGGALTSYTFQGQLYNVGLDTGQVNLYAAACQYSNPCGSVTAPTLNIYGGYTTILDLPATTSGILQLSVLSNSTYAIYLQTAVQTAGTATIDPVISIDSAYQNAGEFSVALSPGVGNTSPVPAPATLTLLLSGLSGLGLLARRKRSAGRPYYNSPCGAVREHDGILLRCSMKRDCSSAAPTPSNATK